MGLRIGLRAGSGIKQLLTKQAYSHCVRAVKLLRLRDARRRAADAGLDFPDLPEEVGAFGVGEKVRSIVLGGFETPVAPLFPPQF
jgi:hypothetical protein